MTMMLTEVYDALKDVGANEKKRAAPLKLWLTTNVTLVTYAGTRGS